MSPGVPVETLPIFCITLRRGPAGVAPSAACVNRSTISSTSSVSPMLPTISFTTCEREVEVPPRTSAIMLRSRPFAASASGPAFAARLTRVSRAATSPSSSASCVADVTLRSAALLTAFHHDGFSIAMPRSATLVAVSVRNVLSFGAFFSALAASAARLTIFPRPKAGATSVM